ncbi:hypothetical protein VD659_10435 [Herbiconiux sp. 11R-BC]|uniref:hypothetical protein n=1 Tax=Herbiconiux sp. 11R-BC TaxID=3111637 RepID=UPI003BFCA3F1
MSHPHLTTVAVLDADARELRAKTAALVRSPGVDIRISAGSLGELLTDPAFPTEVVILQQRAGERVSVNYKIRVCRLADARVIVIAGTDAEGAVSADARVLSSSVVDFADALALVTDPHPE